MSEEAITENSTDTIKLLRNARISLEKTFNEKKAENIAYAAKADKARDEMLRVEGAIQQVDLFIKQFEPKE